MENKKKLHEMKESIDQLRDEINLQAHLGKAEAKDELEKLEQKWQAFQHQCKPFTDEAEKTLEGAGAALGLAADELKAGYERVRKLLKEK